MVKKRFIVPAVLAVVLLGIMCSSLAHLYALNKQYAENREVYESFTSAYVIEHPGPGAVPVESQTASGGNAENMMPDRLPDQVDTIYVAQSLPLSVDFDRAHEVNDEIVAQIYCEGTQINYPVVQHADNEFYLKHNVNGDYSECGAIFMGHSNMSDFSDRNTVLHGHHMNDGSMFGSLEKWGQQNWFDRHKTFYIVTPTKTFSVEMIACMDVGADTTAYRIEFYSDDDVRAWIEDRVSRSGIQTDYVYAPGDRFVTLSTCAYTFRGAKRILVGVLRDVV